MSKDSVIHTLADLVRINSVNPAYEDSQPEGVIAAHIHRYFQDRGIETTLEEVLPDRPNLIARLPGRNPGRRVVFEAHMDTASVTGMTIPPFEPALSEGRLYGRGSCDTKAGLAAMMHALASLKKADVTPPCEIWFAAAVDEEHSFRGAAQLCAGLQADAAIVSEPTEMRAVIASKGVLRWKIHTRGKSAHSSKPHLGVNAITHTARLILALEADSAALTKVKHPLLGHATCNVGVIHGGVQVNFVPDHCVIEVDRRLMPGESAPQVLEHYARLLAQLKTADSSFDAVMDAPMLVDAPLETAPDAVPAQLAGAILSELGLDPTLAGVPFGSDASKFSQRGIPSILIGPGSIDQAHAAVEYVDCQQVEQAVEFYRRFMLRFE
jgi:acetylornithine deacetylase/succinyl-diaminopimelate desuccinylase family protein